MSYLEELRAEVKRRRQLASRKARRIQGTGVDFIGSALDIRSSTPTNKLNTKQLENELAKLVTFASRRTQFVAGHNNRPIPAADWRAYQKAQAKANQRADKLRENYRNIVIDKDGTTIGMRDAYSRPDFPNTANPAVNSPFRKIERVPRQVTTQKALRQMTKQQQKKVDPKFIKQFVKDGKKQLRDMLNVAGQSDMMKDINRLSDKQFHILWGYTGFATDISVAYETRKKKNNPNRADEKLYSDSLQGAREMLEFIKTIEDDPAPKPRKPRRK